MGAIRESRRHSWIAMFRIRNGRRTAAGSTFSTMIKATQSSGFTRSMEKSNNSPGMWAAVDRATAAALCSVLPRTELLLLRTEHRPILATWLRGAGGETDDPLLHPPPSHLPPSHTPS